MRRYQVRLILTGVAVAAAALALAGAALACDCEPTADIWFPAPDAKVRGEAGWFGKETCAVEFTADTGEGCETRRLLLWALSYRGEYKYLAHFSQPYPTWDVKAGLSFCTFRLNNGDGTLKAEVWDTEGAKGQDEQNLIVDNAYLISCTRGTDSNRGSCTWKSWTGNGWSATQWCKTDHSDTGASRGACTTWAIGGCTGACGHGTPHTYCSNGDTPPYTGTGRDYPIIEQVVKNSCNSTLGAYGVKMEPIEAPCGCMRGQDEGIWIHGKYVGGEDPCPDTHTLSKTRGCIHMNNKDVKDLYDIVDTARGRVDYPNIHISVP